MPYNDEATLGSFIKPPQRPTIPTDIPPVGPQPVQGVGPQPPRDTNLGIALQASPRIPPQNFHRRMVNAFTTGDVPGAQQVMGEVAEAFMPQTFTEKVGDWVTGFHRTDGAYKIAATEGLAAYIEAQQEPYTVQDVQSSLAGPFLIPGMRQDPRLQREVRTYVPRAPQSIIPPAGFGEIPAFSPMDLTVPSQPALEVQRLLGSPEAPSPSPYHTNVSPAIDLLSTPFNSLDSYQSELQLDPNAPLPYALREQFRRAIEGTPGLLDALTRHQPAQAGGLEADKQKYLQLRGAYEEAWGPITPKDNYRLMQEVYNTAVKGPARGTPGEQLEGFKVEEARAQQPFFPSIAKAGATKVGAEASMAETKGQQYKQELATEWDHRKAQIRQINASIAEGRSIQEANIQKLTLAREAAESMMAMRADAGELAQVRVLGQVLKTLAEVKDIPSDSWTKAIDFMLKKVTQGEINVTPSEESFWNTIREAILTPKASLTIKGAPTPAAPSAKTPPEKTLSRREALKERLRGGPSTIEPPTSIPTPSAVTPPTAIAPPTALPPRKALPPSRALPQKGAPLLPPARLSPKGEAFLNKLGEQDAIRRKQDERIRLEREMMLERMEELANRYTR